MGGRIAPRYNVLFKYVAAISLTPHGCPGRQLPTLNMGSDTLIFISQSHGKRRGSSSFSPLSLSLSRFLRDTRILFEEFIFAAKRAMLNVDARDLSPQFISDFYRKDYSFCTK